MFSYENLKRNIWGTRNCILPYPWRPFTHGKEENENTLVYSRFW